MTVHEGPIGTSAGIHRPAGESTPFRPIPLGASVVTISQSASTIDANVPVLFRANVTGSEPFVYTWDFGDQGTSAEATPSHAFLQTGNLTIVLHVIDGTGTVETASSAIHVAPYIVTYLPASLPPVAAVGQSVPFAVNVSAGVLPYTFLWQFGDGTQSTDQNPVHAYLHAGTFVSTVLIRDAAGGASQLTFNVLVPLPSGSSPPTGLADWGLWALLGLGAAMGGAGAWWTLRRRR